MHSHECHSCGKKFECPLFDCENQPRKGCAECVGQAESFVAHMVATEWAREGHLVFKRHPNYIGIGVAILLIGLVVSLVLDFGVSPSPLRAVFGWLIILLCIGCIIKAVHWRNRIILTQEAFEEQNRRGLFGRKRQISIPWERVDASEETTNFLGGDAKITIADKSTGLDVGGYGSFTTSNYNVFRSALVSRVTLHVKRIEYRDV